MFSADVAGYSRLMGEDEAATVKTLTTYRNIMMELIKQHRGRVVDSPGDNLLAEFTSVVDAVQCAVAVQKELQARNAELPEDRRMAFRIGINLGDVIEEGDRIYGDGVNIAARLEGLADPGGICISKTAFDQIETKLPLGYDYLGEQTVKNIAKPVGAYQVLMEPRVTVAGKEEKVLPLPEEPSIAVLPFANISGDPEQEYFSDGITENIITGLSGCPKLLVIARNSTFTYKGRPVKVQQVSEELGARYVVEGSIQKAGDRVRISVQLIDATTGHHLWAEKHDRDLKDIFALQDEITIRVLTALEVRLTEGEQARLRLKGPASLEAFMRISKALEYFRRQNKEDNILARREIEEAIPLASDYHSFYVLLAATHINELWYGSESPLDSLARASELVDKALALNKEDSDAHIVLSYLCLMKRQYEEAIAAAERAVALNPNGADAYAQLANSLDASDKSTEAIGLYNKAIRLNPMPPSYYFHQLGNAFFGVGQLEEATRAYEKAIQLEPTNLFAHLGLAAAYIHMGLQEKARASAAEVLRLDPRFSLNSHEKLIPQKNRDRVRSYVEALRQAGLN